jgi:hypothetical protein
MEKEFIPFDRALDLKELGFDEECLARQDLKIEDGGWFSISHSSDDKFLLKQGSYHTLIPLYQQAFKWFREKYGYNGFIYQPNETGYWGHSLENKAKYNSYEEAELACLDKLIEIVKNK